jgi:hypothetical protein
MSNTPHINGKEFILGRLAEARILEEAKTPLRTELISGLVWLEAAFDANYHSTDPDHPIEAGLPDYISNPPVRILWEDKYYLYNLDIFLVANSLGAEKYKGEWYVDGLHDDTKDDLFLGECHRDLDFNTPQGFAELASLVEGRYKDFQ